MNTQGKTRIAVEERPVQEHGMGAQSRVSGLRHQGLSQDRLAMCMRLGGRQNRLVRMLEQNRLCDTQHCRSCSIEHNGS